MHDGGDTVGVYEEEEVRHSLLARVYATIFCVLQYMACTLSQAVKALPLPHYYSLSRVMLPLSAFEEQWSFAFGVVQGLDREAMENALARAEMRAKTPSAKIAARAVRSLKKKIARIAELEGRQDSGKSLSADQVGPVTLCYLVLPCVTFLPITTIVARLAAWCARPPNPRMHRGGTIINHE